MINEEAGILSYRQKEPYYLNITPEDRCFGAVQAAVEWEILDPAVAFGPDDMLSREWMNGRFSIRLSPSDPMTC